MSEAAEPENQVARPAIPPELAHRLVVVTGPSGAGKSTIVQEVIRRSGAAFSVSATTRRPRPTERDGREYHFVGRDEFERMIAEGRMLEWAEVFGDYYGTPAGPVAEELAAGRPVILEIDVQGGLQVAGKVPGATFVLILPPDLDELETRLTGRGTEDEAALRRRLDKAAEEIETAEASGVYTEKVINDDLERATRRVEAIVRETLKR
jgi:guanylate kinase